MRTFFLQEWLILIGRLFVVKEPLISVILPAYNASEYICKSIDSVLKQTYSNWELIVIDDGSTDDTSRILDEYGARQKNIRVIHQMNAGQSAARNVGIRQAKGQYGMFLDADDILDCDAMEKCVDAKKKSSADFLIFQFRRIDSEGKIIDSGETQESNTYPSGMQVSSKQAIQWLLLGMYQNYAWRWFFPICIWRDNHLAFSEKAKMEDADLLPKLLCSIHSVFFMKETLYSYRASVDNSLTNKWDALNTVRISDDMRIKRARYLIACDESYSQYCAADRYNFEWNIVCKALHYHTSNTQERARWQQAVCYIRTNKRPKILQSLNMKDMCKSILIKFGFAKYFR